MEGPDSPSSDRAPQRLDDLPVVDLAEVDIITSDREIALVRRDDDGDIVAPPSDELDGFRGRDGNGTDDSRGTRATSVRDGALHRRGRRHAIVDDDDVPPVHRHGRCVAAHTLLEIARPPRLLFEERRHRPVIVFLRVRRDDRLARRRDGAKRELGLPRVPDLAYDDDVEVGVERERDRVRDDDTSARDAEDKRIALGGEQ